MLRPVPEPPEDERSDCPLKECDGSGWILQEDSTALPCECRQRRINNAASRGMGSGIPKKFRGVSFDRKPICDLDRGLLIQVRHYCDHIEDQIANGEGLWFYGDVGTGKTSVAMLIAKSAIDAGRSVAIYSVPRLLAELRASFDSDSRETFLSLFRRVCAVDLLILDDLGAQRQTDWVLEQLYSIVNERWQDNGAIVVTSNSTKGDRTQPVEALKEEIKQLGDQIQSRATARDLGPIVERLERIVADLQELDIEPHVGHLASIKAQLGERTVSRLREICGDPIPVMGPDLRLMSLG